MSRLFRSRSDRYVTGLSGGLAETLGIDSTWIRLILVFTTFFSGGVVIVLYFLAALVIPKEPRDHGPFGPGYGFEGAGAPNWNGQAGPGWGQQPWGQEWNGKNMAVAIASINAMNIVSTTTHSEQMELAFKAPKRTDKVKQATIWMT